jgi:hypothetical protein
MGSFEIQSVAVVDLNCAVMWRAIELVFDGVREMDLFAVIAADESDISARSKYQRSKSEQTLRVTMRDPRAVGGGNRNLFQKRACLGH